MKKYLFLLMVISISNMLNAQTMTNSSSGVTNQNNLLNNNDSITSNITIKTFQTGTGWGYDIFIDGKKYIHQQTIPSVSGNNPFKTKKDVENTAKLVKQKISKNIMPPSVTVKELDSLGIVK